MDASSERILSGRALVLARSLYKRNSGNSISRILLPSSSFCERDVLAPAFAMEAAATSVQRSSVDMKEQSKEQVKGGGGAKLNATRPERAATRL